MANPSSMFSHKVATIVETGTADPRTGRTRLKIEEYVGYCRHCDNSGTVMIDQTDAAMPCPMCNMGQARDFTKQWAGLDVYAWSWNGGLTIHHVTKCVATTETGPKRGEQCKQPARQERRLCDWHARPNEERAAVYAQFRKVRATIDAAAEEGGAA